MVKLLIVESPGKIKKLRSFLGGGWEIAASVGHICDLPKRDLGIRRTEEKIYLSFSVYPDKADVVTRLQHHARNAKEIYLATDPDREGEAIAYHVGIALGKDHWSKIKRISFNAITKEAVLEAIDMPRRIDMDLVHAQQARRVVDRLVGYRVSPLLWKKKNVGTSAGRVQSVAVKLVADREREIRSFVPTDYFMIRAELLDRPENGVSFEAILSHFKGKDIVSRLEDGKQNTQRMLTDETEVHSLIKQFQPGPWTVVAKSSRKQKRRPYPPFVTSSLQQASSTRLKWNATKTMKVAQSLYEKGLITYMRTDSPGISKEALQAVRGFIQKEYGDDYLPKKPHTYKARDSRSQESHECIRPTDLNKASDQLQNIPGPERDLYRLIRSQFIACQMKEAEYRLNTIDIDSQGGLFKAKGKTLLFDGWTACIPSRKKDDAIVPEVKKGQIMTLEELRPTTHQTRPPARYSEASLIKTMEAHSIGRPSTFASIIANIKQRGYIKESKRMFHATELGEALVDFLMESFSKTFMDVSFTARMEDQLDKITEGDQDWQDMISRFDDILNQVLQSLGVSPRRGTIATLEEECPECSKKLAMRSGQYGDFIGCTGYPSCTYSRPLPPKAASS